MDPTPKHCLICGREISTGIDSHIRNTHQMDYEFYRRWFYDAEGSYSIYDAGRKDRIVLTITRTLRSE